MGLVDAFVKTKVKEKKNKIMIPVGGKMPVDIGFSSGGGGTNTAASISNLGLKTGFIGKIGKGHNSEIVMRELKKHKVDFLGVRSSEHTGYSIILETEKGRRTILTFKSVSNNLKISEINLKKVNTSWMHFTSMSGESFKSQKKLIDFLLKKKIKISFNPGMSQIKKNDSGFNNMIKNTYFLSMNLEEATALVGKFSFRDLFKKLKALGPKIICITNGKKGGGIYDGNFLYQYKPHKIKVAECTGAGDTFVSSILVGLIKFKDVETAIKLAISNSESVIQERGAKNGLLKMKDAKKLIKKNRFNIEKSVL